MNIFAFPEFQPILYISIKDRGKMAVPVKISIEQLAESLNGLSASERNRLKSLLHNHWFQTEEVNETIFKLLEESLEQHKEGEFRPSEDILRDSKEKYGL